ncbi:MAG: prepilin-type N-terminal cleavage/methylation domain-containing protein [Verrucomicrobiales bacterium]|jgi:prepilin-type N-terminal cleavage/methylation domain-containing protein
MEFREKPLSQRAFTLVEILMVVACIGILVGLSVQIISGMISSTKEKKLGHDVRVLNSAVATFVANGGDLEGAKSASEVFVRLRSSTSSDQADRLVGVRSGFFDLRMIPVMQTSDEAVALKSRVLWDVTKSRFAIYYQGKPGIKEFLIDDSKSSMDPPERERKLVIAYSKKGDAKWVWDYNDAPTVTGNKRSIEVLDSKGAVIPLPPSAPHPLQLTPPNVSVPPDTYPLMDYEDLNLTLRNPNPAGVSEMFYSIREGIWLRYQAPFPIDPGAVLMTQAVSNDPASWHDSAVSTGNYKTELVQLITSLVFPKQNYNYVSLGGATEPGSYPPPVRVHPGRVELTNGSSLPVQFQNSKVFEVAWTLQGTNDPQASAKPMTSDPFSGGFPGQDILLSIDDWGPSDALVVQAYANSHNLEIVTNAEPVSAILNATRIQLRPPLVEIMSSAGRSKNKKVTISCQTNFGDTPLGARIFYTTDGSDPGAGPDGEPVTTKYYSGPFQLPAGATEIIARVYAPGLYHHWFLPSEPSSGPEEPGLIGGHIDVDTSTFIATINSGKTGGHVHEYDDTYGVTEIDFFNLLSSSLENIDDAISTGRKFKLIVANADLSPGAKIVINSNYDSRNPLTYIPVKSYDDTPLADLPVYSFKGIAGTVPLTRLSLSFDNDAIKIGGVIPTNTGDVRNNTLGLNGEWRNGALTIQAIEVNGSGRDKFVTDQSLSAGGVQGVATSGLLWESTVFWHWKGDSYHENRDYVPGKSVPSSWLEDVGR